MSDAAPALGSRDLILVEDEKEKSRYLKECGAGAPSTMVWTRDQSHVLETHIVMMSEVDRSLYLHVPYEQDATKLNTELLSRSDRDCFFSVSIPSANLFFKAEHQGVDTAGLRFKWPELIHKVQRRSHLRFRIPQDYPYAMRIEFNHPLYPSQRMGKKIFDLSAGGCSVLIGQDEAPLFFNTLELSEFRFHLRQNELQCHAEVRHIRPSASESSETGMKLGLKFIGLSPTDTKLIGDFVLNEFRKAYAK